jgi:hypothetical protein
MRLFCLIVSFFFADVLYANEFDDYKDTCKAIGFKVGTEKFADCVMQIYKKERIKQSEETARVKVQEKINQQIVEKKNKVNENTNKQYLEEARQYFANQQAIYEKQMALYEQQKRDYDQEIADAQRERKQAAARKLMEFGLRTAAGTSPYASVNIDRAWADTNGTRPVMQQPAMPSIQPPTSYSIQTPNGFVYCNMIPGSGMITCK